MKNIGFPECARGCPEVIGKTHDLNRLRQRNAILANALSSIANWEFNIMGDCVKDAQQLAENALREEYKILIGKL